MRKSLTDAELVALLGECRLRLDEKKAEDTIVMDLSAVNSYFDYFVVTSGSSNIHCRALARDLQKFFQERGMKEGVKPDLNSGWIILDYSSIIVHIFTEELRSYYRLEKLWADARRIEFEQIG